MLWISLKSSVD